MKIMGISALYHDSAAVLIEDGNIIAANQEERFSRVKHDSSFPYKAINACLEQSKAGIKDIDVFVFYEKPYSKFERITETIYAFAPKGFISFKEFIKGWSLKKFSFEYNLKDLDINPKAEILYSSHHLSHAASAFFPSPFEESAVLTVDGVGEYSTTLISKGIKNDIIPLKEIRFPHSIGLFYSAFTYFLGFKVNSGEYKLMGLAPYGNKSRRKNDFKEKIKKEIMDIKKDGSIFLNQAYFEYCTGNKMINEKKFFNLFGFKKRLENEEINQEHCDLALAVQELTEEVMLNLARTAKNIVNSQNLCLAGGVALNCVSNSKILESEIFKNIWVQPAAGDGGGALGAALGAYHIHYGKERKLTGYDKMKGSFIGVEFSNDEIKRSMDKFEAVYDFIEYKDLVNLTATLLAQGNIIGWFQGKMEWGPRALGNRSILADPRNDDMQQKINLKIKRREGFRPFASSVMEEFVEEYFSPAIYSPYMLFVSYFKGRYRNILPDGYENIGVKGKLEFKKSLFPAVTHVDFSSRIQSVNQKTNPLFYGLIKEFYKITGCPMILNTSFNLRGEPIVATPEDAYRCFVKTDMDYLVIGNFFIERKKQKYKEEIDLDKLND